MKLLQLTTAVQVKRRINLIDVAHRVLLGPLEYAMNLRHSIFKEPPPDVLIPGLNFSAVTRQQYISSCKARALAILASGDKYAAIDTMLRDLVTWEGGSLFDAGELEMRRAEATFYTSTLDEVRRWIADFR
jgi:hypothetical protein